MTRPNILYIHSHDTGRYVEPYGYAVPTPNIQKLAEGGVVFRRNFCVNPTCSASRSGLLTATYPHQNGMTGLAHRGFRLNDYREHLCWTLKDAGYTTALSGVQHVIAHEPNFHETLGYDRYLTDGKTSPQDAAVEYLDDAPDEPFFLSVGFGMTHRAFPDPDPEDRPDYSRPPEYFPDTPETRRDFAAFKKSARLLDDAMGRVFDALDRNGLAENTLVVCTTDHGIAFPRMKCNLVDGGIGVMLIMRGPGGFDGGKVVDALVSHVDVFPTICDLVGVDVPERARGASLRPLVTGEAESIRDAVFAEVNYHASYEPMRCVRTDRFKYIRRYADRRRTTLPNCDASPTKEFWNAHGWARREQDDEQLYDTVFDPVERRNIADDPEYAEALATMRERLDAWMRETEDPLLTTGWIEPPLGAIVNDPADTQPSNDRKWVWGDGLHT